MSKGYTTKPTAAKTDCTGLLSVCINYLDMPLDIPIVTPSKNKGGSTDIFHKNREARNELLHSSTFSLSQAERQVYIKDMITLLKTYKQHTDPVTQVAIDELEKLHSLDISAKISINARGSEPEGSDIVSDDSVIPEVNTVGLVIPAEDELDILETTLKTLEDSLGDIDDMIKQQEDLRAGREQFKLQLENIIQSLTVLKARLCKFPDKFENRVAEMQFSCKSMQKKNEELRQQLLMGSD